MTGENVYPKIVFDDVRLEGATKISESAVQDAIATIKGLERWASPNWWGEIEEFSIRGTRQDQGFFKVKSKADPRLLYGDSTTAHYSLTFHVEEGPQYRLGTVRFRTHNSVRNAPSAHTSSSPVIYLSDEPPPAPKEKSSNPQLRRSYSSKDNPPAADSSYDPIFSEEELRARIPMSEGDIFSAEKVRQALDNLKKLYASHGYIDFVATPLTDIDDSNLVISLVMELDEEHQYHFGKITVIGLDLITQNSLIWPFNSGDIFDYSKFEQFFLDNKAILPECASAEDVQIARNVKYGIVNLRFDLRPCPSATN